eukprot:m.56140 g.56140  ORF g.56140 m.56140 type:complete len:77 (-) comp11176_c0_seq1:577-807(-)
MYSFTLLVALHVNGILFLFSDLRAFTSFQEQGPQIVVLKRLIERHRIVFAAPSLGFYPRVSMSCRIPGDKTPQTHL